MKKENEKKRINSKAKKESINRFINNLCPKNNATKTWAFAKASINGKRAQELNCSPNDPETNQTVTSAKEKERIFSIQYDNQTDYIPDDPKLELNITRGREYNEPNTLNSKITGNELERATRQLNRNQWETTSFTTKW